MNIVTKEQINIISIRKFMPIRDICKNLTQLDKIVNDYSLNIIGPSIAIYHSKEVNIENMDIELCYQVEESNDDIIKKFGPFKCCSMKHIGSFENISDTYNILFTKIQEQKFEIVAAPFEVYLSIGPLIKESDFVTEVCVPIK